MSQKLQSKLRMWQATALAAHPWCIYGSGVRVRSRRPTAAGIHDPEKLPTVLGKQCTDRLRLLLWAGLIVVCLIVLF